MKKKLIPILILTLSLALLFAGCASYKQNPVDYGAKASDPVVSNGGLVVKKGDYYYYINGKAGSASAENVWGKTVKGSLMASKADKLGEEQVIIIPKLLYSETAAGGGFSIYDDYIYYTSPNDEKNKAGNIQSGYMDFMRTKLDGTGTEKLFTPGTESQTIQYRYFYNPDTKAVRLVYILDSKLYSLDCNNPKSNGVIEEHYTGTPLFGGMNDNSIYYTAAVYTDRATGEEISAEEYRDADDDRKAQIRTETYNKVMRYDVFGGKAEEIYRDAKYTVALSKVDEAPEGSYLYYTLTEVSGGTGAKKLMRTQANAPLSKDNDVFVSPNTSLTGYLTAPEGKGILWQNTNTIDWAPLPASDKSEVPVYKRLLNVTGTTLYQIMKEGDTYYLYYFESEILKRMTLPSYTELVKDDFSWVDKGDPGAVMKDNRRKDDEAVDKMDTSWIKPEYLDGKWWFFNSAADAFDANTKDEDKEHDDATMYFRSGYLFVYDTTTEGAVPVRIGELTAANKETEEEKLKEENEDRAEKREEAAKKEN